MKRVRNADFGGGNTEAATRERITKKVKCTDLATPDSISDNDRVSQSPFVPRSSHTIHPVVLSIDPQLYNRDSNAQQGCRSDSTNIENNKAQIRLEPIEGQQHLVQQTMFPSVSSYGDTIVTGQATAFLGNITGNVYMSQSPSLGASYKPLLHRSNPTTERYNRVFASYTLETIIAHNDADSTGSIGASCKTQLRWQRREDIGEGVFGEVHREECLDNGVIKSRAVKVLRLRQLKRMKINYKKEIGALLRLSQPQYVQRFVELFSWYQTGSTVHLAMEYVKYGDLTRHIRRGLSTQDAQQIAYQVLHGISTLHSLEIIHRDIKPSNVFVVQYEPRWWVKIGDFSIAESTLTDLTTLHTVVGTVGYQAPEILSFVAPEKAQSYNEKCDIWSFGCVLYEICTGYMLCNSPVALQFCCNNGLLTLLPPDLDNTLADFLLSLLQCSPTNRPGAEEALEMGEKWFCLSPVSHTIIQQNCTQDVRHEQLEIDFAPSQPIIPFAGVNPSIFDSEIMQNETMRNQTTQEATTQGTTGLPLDSYCMPEEYLGTDVADVICFLVACSSAAMSSMDVTSYTAPQHLLQVGDWKRPTPAETAPIPKRIHSNLQIALRLSSNIKSHSEGFKFGRNPKYCDILLADDLGDSIVSNTHFTIFFDQQARLVIEDCSTNGTFLNHERLLSNSSGGNHLPRQRRELTHGSLISVVVRKNGDCLTFLVRMPARNQYEAEYVMRLEKYRQSDVSRDREPICVN